MQGEAQPKASLLNGEAQPQASLLKGEAQPKASRANTKVKLTEAAHGG
jgi:hypothetical protein